MALNGAGLKLISTVTHPSGHPGGSYQATIQIQPLGSYPALGEPIADLLTALAATDDLLKVAAGVTPDSVFISSVQDAGFWTWDPVQKTFRYWTALTPTEHATGVYSAGELAAVARFTMFFPLFGSTSR